MARYPSRGATATAAVVIWLATAGSSTPQLVATRGSNGGSVRPGPAFSGDIVFTEIPAARTRGLRPSAGMLRASYGDGGRLVLLGSGGSTQVLTTDFESAADPSVSFDGKRILFAGKKSAGDHWNIYEMNADGSGVRQITRDLGDCRSPIYQSPIFYLDDPGPMPQIAFVSSAPGSVTEYGGAGATAVYSARMDGSGIRRLTYNPSGAFDPSMLPDGRMLFSSWMRHGTEQGLRGRVALFATNIDGTDYATFSGDQGARIQAMACVTAKRLVLFVEAGPAAWDGAGPLGLIDLRRNLHSYRPLPLPREFVYHSPSPMPDGTVLVSRRPADGSGTHAVFRLDPETGRLDPVFRSAGAHIIQAHAVAPRTVPDGRSSVVDETQAWAKLYCLNLYESDLGARVWPHGLVKRIRILEGLPLQAGSSLPAAGLSPLLQTRFLGEVDVDGDGSFHVQIPANVPVQVQALDEEGMALRSSAWVWAKNKEQRGCIGCHEDGERTPENRMVSALTRPGANLMLPPERRRRIEFETDIAPVLAQKCATVACHGAAAQLKLSGKGRRFSAAYEALLAKDVAGAFRYVTPGAARTSPLIWAVFGRNTSRPWDRAAPVKAIVQMPPAGSPILTPIERRAIVEWIDLGAHFHGLPPGPAAAGGAQ
jgi:hypothetical protein